MDYGAYKRKEDIVDEYDSEEDAAPPPPVRMAKAPTQAKSKSSSKRSSSSLLGYRASQTSLTVHRSQQNPRGSTDTASIGMPSIERLHNSSTTSLASSADTAHGRGLRHKKSREALNERINGFSPNEDTEKPGLGLLDGATKFLGPTRSRQSLKNETATSSPRPELLRADTSQSSVLSATSPVSPISHRSSHSASSQGALNGHLIPSRRSSLRYSINGSIREDDQKRYSMNLEDMAIDKSLIEEDHSTVKRIRELQEAREKRQKEWRKESKKSDRSKRNGITGSKILRRTSSRQSSHMSIAEEVTPTAELAEDNASSGNMPQNGISAPRPASRASNTSAIMLTPPRKSSRPQVPVTRTQGSIAPSTGSTSPLKNGMAVTNGATIVPNLYNKHQGTVDDEVEAFLDSPRLTQTVRHPRTGRIIAFSEVGDPEGFAVICCVGMGLTRYLTAFYDELARTLKLRLITPDRPGIGESEPSIDGSGMPLNWPDDVELICDHLGITKFSLLAHSAGALYALATALRIPQMTRGRIHLLAPWITPSQMAAPGLSKEPSPAANIPFSQKILSILPASFLKAANASFFGAASASIAKSPKPSAQRRSLVLSREKSPMSDGQRPPTSASVVPKREAVSCYQATNNALVSQGVIPQTPTKEAAPVTASLSLSRTKTMTPREHRAAYDAALTPRIWDLATTNANPAVDLIICLEKHAPIGFLYTDITRAVVIHHGSRDTRVPVDNVRWLANRMKRCELRVLEGEGHGLMASANVMAEILGEIGGEWEEWARVVKGKKGRRRAVRAGEYQLELGDEDEEE
jgi:pimeloyl-ACP methyl ester carboxylesterase